MSNATTRLRKFIVETFSDDDLNAFCFDNFPQVAQSFTAGQTKDQRVSLLLEYCRQKDKSSDLALALRRKEPELYRKKLDDIDPAEWNSLIDHDRHHGCQMTVNIAIALGAVIVVVVIVVGPKNLSALLNLLTSTPTPPAIIAMTSTPTVTPTILPASTDTETPMPTAPTATVTPTATSTPTPTVTLTRQPAASPAPSTPAPVPEPTPVCPKDQFWNPVMNRCQSNGSPVATPKP